MVPARLVVPEVIWFPPLPFTHQSMLGANSGVAMAVRNKMARANASSSLCLGMLTPPVSPILCEAKAAVGSVQSDVTSAWYFPLPTTSFGPKVLSLVKELRRPFCSRVITQVGMASPAEAVPNLGV